MNETREDIELCSRCSLRPASYGFCPYADEINNEEVVCDCCEECRYQCAMDIWRGGGVMTDALRHNSGKPELSYILSMPNAVKGFAAVCTYGETKYERFNYLKGAPLQQYMDCALRHLTAWYNGEDNDPESGCHHLDHLAWNALMLSEIAKSQPERDDRPCVQST